MTLEEYRKLNRLSYRSLGNMLDISPTYAWYVCNGRKTVSLPLLNSIVKATNGQVTPADLGVVSVVDRPEGCK